MKKNPYLSINEEHKYLNFGEQPNLFCIQLGYEFVPLVDEKKGAPLLDKITKYRKQVDEEYGLFLPPIRIVDNMSLKPSEYAILFNGIEVGRGDIPKGYCYCLDTGEVKTPLNCDSWIKTKDPAFEMEAFLVPKERIKEYRDAGYVCARSEQIISVHLYEIIRKFRTRILNQNMVNSLLDKVCKINPDVITDVFFTNKFDTSDMKLLLNSLLAEDVSIRDMNTILEAIADNIKDERNPIKLAEKVRERLAYSFISQYADENKCVHVIRFSKSSSVFLAEKLYLPQEKNEIPYFAFQPKDRRLFIEKICDGLSTMNKKGLYPLFIIESPLRLALFEALRFEMPGVRVISDREIFFLDNKLSLEIEAEIKLDE